MITQLINDKYIRQYSLFPSNYDLTEVRNFIGITENIHVIPIIGINLYNKLLEMINNDTLDENYSELLVNIYKLEGIALYFETLPFVWSHLSQVGITLGKSDNSDSLTSDDLNFILERVKSNINFNKDSLVAYLEANKDKFPEYVSHDNECGENTNNKSKLFYSFFYEDWNVN